MRYISIDDMLSIRGIGTASGLVMSPEDVENYINKAEDLVDARLKGSYVTPFQPPIPPLIKLICMKLATCLILQDTKSISADEDGEISSVKYVCNEAYDLLNKLASGELIIDAATPSSEQAGIGMYWYGRTDLKRE